MNHFETVQSTILNSLSQYQGTYSHKDFQDLIAYQMRYYAKIIKKHKHNEQYSFNATDIEIITHRILGDILPR